jgi:N-formylglutamate amidohydrolase
MKFLAPFRNKTLLMIALLAGACILVRCSQEVGLPAGKIVESYDTASFAVGEVKYGYNNYTEYIVGDAACPIILSSPHGGYEVPANIPDRRTGVTDADLNTQELTRDIANAIYARTGLRPHVIINKLHRRKMDANRAIVEAAEGNNDAEKAWADYHYFIKSARRIVTENVGKGIYFDMHGHGHAINRIEVGYLLTKYDLAKTDDELSLLVNKSSIRAVALGSQLTLAELVRGPSSFGSLLDMSGYNAVPSLDDPQPGVNNDFFEGGYSTQVHGSVNEGTISAIQLECNRPGLRDTDANRKAFAEKMATSIVEYLHVHYNIDL